MKLLTGLRHFVLSVIMLISVNVSAQLSAIETNPMQYAIITEMSNKLDAEASTQISSFNKMAATQGMICSEVDGMKKWQKNYNNYLQNARGYAEAIKAATTLYADGVEILRNIFDIKKACKDNPQGVAASLAWSDIYLELAAQYAKTYSVLNKMIAKGGKGNMLNGQERTELLYQLNDEMARLNVKLRTVAINISYHNLTDVWNKFTAGLVAKSHKQIASESMERWRRASTTAYKMGR